MNIESIAIFMDKADPIMTNLEEICIASGKTFSKFTTEIIFYYTFLFSSDIAVIKNYRKVICE